MSRLNASQPIVDATGAMEQPFREYMNLLSRYVPIIGTGSPEGVVEAPQFSRYIDQNGVTGSIEYLKMQPQVGGDRKQGWVLV